MGLNTDEKSKVNYTGLYLNKNLRLKPEFFVNSEKVAKLIEFGGPEGLRSLGSPVMSRLLYQAELRAPRKKVLS